MLLAVAALPVGAQTALNYEATVRAALVVRGCASEADGARGDAEFARRLSRTLGVPGAELTDRRIRHHAALSAPSGGWPRAARSRRTARAWP